MRTELTSPRTEHERDINLVQSRSQAQPGNALLEALPQY